MSTQKRMLPIQQHRRREMNPSSVVHNHELINDSIPIVCGPNYFLPSIQNETQLFIQCIATNVLTGQVVSWTSQPTDKISTPNTVIGLIGDGSSQNSPWNTILIELHVFGVTLMNPNSAIAIVQATCQLRIIPSNTNDQLFITTLRNFKFTKGKPRNCEYDPCDHSINPSFQFFTSGQPSITLPFGTNAPCDVLTTTSEDPVRHSVSQIQLLVAFNHPMEPLCQQCSTSTPTTYHE